LCETISGQFNFNVTGIDEKCEIGIYDLRGKINISKEIVTDEFIAINSLQQGIYLLIIKTKEGYIVKNIARYY
jgi:hypothetical protein